MSEATIQPDAGNDLALQNNGGTGKIVVGNGAEITVSLGGAAGDDLSVDGGTLVVESDTNRVGIGIAAPTATLDCNGAAKFNDNNLSEIGDISADSISTDDAAVGLSLNFGGNTTLNKINLTDNLADALNLLEGSDSYLKISTTDGSEKIIVSVKFETSTTTKMHSLGNCFQTNFHAALFFGY